MRILEATISIVLILSALAILSSKQEVREEKDLAEMLPKILDEIARNQTLRKDIILNNPDLNTFVGKRINNPSLDFAVKICALDETCVLDNFPEDVGGDIFASERVVSAVIDSPDFVPKKVKIFLWKKE